MSVRVAVLISGSGSNLAALLDAEAKGDLSPAQIAIVLSNRAEAGGLAKARAAGKATVVVDHRDFEKRRQFERAMIAALEQYEVTHVVLAGFMRVLTPMFVDRFRHRMINVHPSLLPAFPGVNGAQQALDYGVRLTGATVHFVESGVDTGPIIAQAAVPVLSTDDATSLQRRIQAEEHRLLPAALRALARGELRVEGRRVHHADAKGDAHQ